MARVLPSCLLILTLLAAPAGAWWPWSPGPCCEEAGWYQLDGGPLSWACTNRPDTGLWTLEDYIKEGDYSAARQLAGKLMDGPEECFWWSETMAVEFYVPSSKEFGSIRPARPRGENFSYFVFGAALKRPKETMPTLSAEAQDFVRWADEETQKRLSLIHR